MCIYPSLIFVSNAIAYLSNFTQNVNIYTNLYGFSYNPKSYPQVLDLNVAKRTSLLHQSVNYQDETFYSAAVVEC